VSGDTLTRVNALVARLQTLIDEGKVDDPSIAAFVQSISERLDGDRFDEITVAQLERLAELAEGYGA
jgi:hypothetical protein